MAALDDGPAELAARISRCHRLFRRLERLGRPVIAAVNGAAIGGGYQIALACHHRIALDAPGSRIGLPEAGYGILPDLGGVTRTVRMFGVEAALDTLLLDGRLYAPREAADLGLVDDVATTPERMISQARRWIADHPGACQPWDVPGYRVPGSAGLPTVLPLLAAAVRNRTGGAVGKVGRNIVAAAVEGSQVDFDTALAIETRYAIELALDPVFRNRMTAVLDRREISANAAVPEEYVARLRAALADETRALLGEGVPAASVHQAVRQAGHRCGPPLAGNGHGFTDAVPFADVGERMLFRQALEAVRCVEEGVVPSIAHANVGSLHGAGFPEWTGGAVRYIDQYGAGPGDFVARARDFAASYGSRFDPPPALIDAARAGTPYRRPASGAGPR